MDTDAFLGEPRQRPGVDDHVAIVNLVEQDIVDFDIDGACFVQATFQNAGTFFSFPEAIVGGGLFGIQLFAL